MQLNKANNVFASLMNSKQKGHKKCCVVNYVPVCIIQKIDYSKRKGGYLYFEDGLFLK